MAVPILDFVNYKLAVAIYHYHRPRAEKPQRDGRLWSGGCVVLERL